MSFGWIEIWQHMGVPAMVIAGILVVMGLASLTVFIERIITLRRSRSRFRPCSRSTSCRAASSATKAC